MSSRQTWRVTVYPEYDPRGDGNDGPIVDGIIRLTGDEAKTLAKRLTAISDESEGFVGPHELYLYEAPEPVTEADLLTLLLSGFNEDGQREMAEVWNDPEKYLDPSSVLLS